MTNLQIHDLSSEKNLDTGVMRATSGGFNFGTIGGQAGNQLVGGGGGILSPVTAVNVPVNVPVLVGLDVNPKVSVGLDLDNVIASAGTGIAK
jgi:hypothetical protein